MALGVIGEYLAHMFIEAKQRPLYLVQRYLRSAAPIAAPEELATEHSSRWHSR